MTTPIPATAGAALRPRAAAVSRVLLLRSLVVAGCVLAVALAAWYGNPAARLAADADLARLLRGMAIIKGCLALGATGIVLWRLGRPVPTAFATIYVVGCWWLAAAAVLVWQLTVIPLAAIGFHVAELGMLFVALRDYQDGRPGRDHARRAG